MADDPKVLETENESLREDAEDYTNRIEDLKEQVERLTAERDTALTLATSAGRDAKKQIDDLDATEAEMERRGGRITSLEGQVQTLTEELAKEKAAQEAYEENQVGDANEAAISSAREIAELNKKVRELEGLVFSMRMNGAKHHFVYGYQKHNGTTYIDHCGICEQDKGHPAHFAQGARYLDSREIEVAAKAAQERLCGVLLDGGLGHRTVLNTAREILRGLPGIDPFQEVSDRPKVKARVCNVGCGFDEDHHDDVTVPYPHRFSWGTVPRIHR